MKEGAMALQFSPAVALCCYLGDLLVQQVLLLFLSVGIPRLLTDHISLFRLGGWLPLFEGPATDNFS